MKLLRSLPCIAAVGITILSSSCIRGLRVEMRQPVDRLAAVGTTRFEAVAADTVRAPWTSGNHVDDTREWG